MSTEYADPAPDLVNSIWKHNTMNTIFYYRCTDIVFRGTDYVLRFETEYRSHFYLSLNTLQNSEYYYQVEDKEELAMITLYLMAMKD